MRGGCLEVGRWAGKEGVAHVILVKDWARFAGLQRLGNSLQIQGKRCDGMRKLFILGFVILASTLVPCSRAQTRRADNPSVADLREEAKEKEAKQDELVNLEKETARALQWNSGGLFRRIYGEDFTAILPTGQILDKAGWISAIENTSNKYKSFVASDIRVRMFEESAVVTCLWSATGTNNGHAFSRQYRVTHVYVYGQRGWQAVASQETLLPG